MENGNPQPPLDSRFTTNVLGSYSIVVADTLIAVCRESPQTVTREWIYAHLNEAARRLPEDIRLSATEFATLLEMIATLDEMMQFGLES